MNQNTLENATSSHLHMQSQVVDLSELKSTNVVKETGRIKNGKNVENCHNTIVTFPEEQKFW